MTLIDQGAGNLMRQDVRASNKKPLAALHRLAVPLVLSATVRLAIGILLNALSKLHQSAEAGEFSNG